MEAMALGTGTRNGIMASDPNSLPLHRSSSAVTQGCDVSELQPPASDVTQVEGGSLAPTSPPGSRANEAVWSWYTLFYITVTGSREMGRPKGWVSGGPCTIHLFPHLGSASTGE